MLIPAHVVVLASLLWVARLAEQGEAYSFTNLFIPNMTEILINQIQSITKGGFDFAQPPNSQSFLFSHPCLSCSRFRAERGRLFQLLPIYDYNYIYFQVDVSIQNSCFEKVFSILQHPPRISKHHS